MICLSGDFIAFQCEYAGGRCVFTLKKTKPQDGLHLLNTLMFAFLYLWQKAVTFYCHVITLLFHCYSFQYCYMYEN